MIRFPFTLSTYVGKQFLLGVGMVFAVLAAIVMIFDSLEIMRRGYARDVPAGLIFEMIIMRMPFAVQRITPFAVLLGGILSYVRMTKTSELIVARAAGVSVWQFLAPPVILSFVLGVFLMTVFNPLASSMLRRFEQIEGQYLKGKTSMLSISSSGLWLRQQNENDDGKTVLHAMRVSQDDMSLFEVTIFVFDAGNIFKKRINAGAAALHSGYWMLDEVFVNRIGEPTQFFKQYQLETDLSIEQIQESFASPETMSFWELPEFIETMREAGFSAMRHSLHWHSLVVLPFLFSAMVFIAAAFSLRPPRQGKTGLLMVGGILTGFVIYFLSDLVAAIGLSGRIPIPLAAWAPVGISIFMGAAATMHLEDG